MLAELTVPSAAGILTAAEVAFAAVAGFIVLRLGFRAGVAFYAKITGKG